MTTSTSFLSEKSPMGEFSRHSPYLDSQEETCPVRNLSSRIDSCIKAKIVAAMALHLFVFDGRHHATRTNWACPFSHCKDNFADPKALMGHVLACSHFSSDGVYCNSCCKNDCFEFLRRSSISSSSSSASSSCGCCEDKATAGPTKKHKTLRKLTSFFSGSRPSSPVSQQFDNPPRLRPDSLYTSPPQSPRPFVGGAITRTFKPAMAPVVTSRHEMEAPLLCELSEDNTIPPELPGSVGPSNGSKAAAYPIFADDSKLTESPLEDLSMSTMMASTPTMINMPPITPPYPPFTGGESSQSAIDRRPPALWANDSSLQVDLPFQPYENPQSLHHQYLPATPADWHSWVPTPTFGQSRSNSGDSWPNPSTTPPVADPRPRYYGQRELFSTSTPNMASMDFAPSSPSPLTAVETLECSECSYRPSGMEAHHAAYLKKHMKTHTDKPIECNLCHSWIKRPDNLKPHQRSNVCSSRRSLASCHRQDEEQEGEYQSSGGTGRRPLKRARIGSTWPRLRGQQILNF